jgi:hypothetical protein
MFLNARLPARGSRESKNWKWGLLLHRNRARSGKPFTEDGALIGLYLAATPKRSHPRGATCSRYKFELPVCIVEQATIGTEHDANNSE